MTRLATALGIAPQDLLPATAGAGPAPAAAKGPPPSDGIPGPRLPPRDPRDLIPVRSAARGGGEQQMFLDDGPIDYIPRPHSLQHVRDAYSTYMVGDSMAPRFRPGQLLHVNPYKPPQPGTGVVVRTRDDAMLIKEFVRRSDTTLYLKQYNPAAELDFPLAEIREIHIVVGLDEP
jgi:phage repressor protein C with HTH and peptisase S24 domain